MPPEDARTRRAELVKTFDSERARAIGRQLKGRQIWLVPTLIWSDSLRPLSPSDNGADLPLDIVPADARKRWQDNRARYLESAPPEAFTAASDVARVSGFAIGILHAAGARVLAGTDVRRLRVAWCQPPSGAGTARQGRPAGQHRADSS